MHELLSQKAGNGALGLWKIALMCSLFWIALASWSLSLPVGVSPDEEFHQTMVYCSGKNVDPKCGISDKAVGHCYSMYPLSPAKCSEDKGLVFPASKRIAFSSYPPIYYKTMHLLVGKTLGDTTRKVRLANVTLAILMALLSVRLSHPNLRRAVAISWLICSVPLGIFFISSISPSSWAIISMAALWGPLLTLFCKTQPPFIVQNHRASWSVIRILFIVFVMTLGLGSRNEPYILIPLIFLTTLTYWYLGKKYNWIAISKIFLCIGSAILLVLLFAPLADSLQAKYQYMTNNAFVVMASEYILSPKWKSFYMAVNTLLGTLALTGIPGSEIGTHDVPTPAIAGFLITMAFGGSFLLGLSWMDRKKLVSLSFLIFSIIFIVSFLWSGATWDVYQSRYFLPILYPILGFALMPRSKMTKLYNRSQWLIVFSCAVLANSIMLLSAELRFIFGAVFLTTRYPLNKEFPDINPARLYFADVPNWWLAPKLMPPFFLWTVGSISFLIATLFLFQWVTSPTRRSFGSNKVR